MLAVRTPITQAFQPQHGNAVVQKFYAFFDSVYLKRQDFNFKNFESRGAGGRIIRAGLRLLLDSARDAFAVYGQAKWQNIGCIIWIYRSQCQDDVVRL